MKITRRSVVAALGAGAAAGCVGPAATRYGPVRFDHGVASGDPSADGAVIWTRVSPADPAPAAVPLRWVVAASAGGAPVSSGWTEAQAERDFTCKVELRRLRPGGDYWYWFEGPGGVSSPSGRFRTLPAGRVDDLALVVASCQLYSAGYFNAWRAVAGLERLDAVIHLGDYIYEYGPDYGPDVGAASIRVPDPPHETVTLEHYRRRHAQCKLDPDLQAAHARAAFICVWDDHESADNAWSEGATNHQPDEGGWSARRAASLRAYMEWMPIRERTGAGGAASAHRSFRFGDLARLVMLESRHLARDRQARVPEASYRSGDFQPVLAELNASCRAMIGEEQRRWVERELADSVRRGEPWQLIGNQVLMARVAGPDFEAALGKEAFARLAARYPAELRARLLARLRSFQAGLPLSLDSWDGYPCERERLYESFRRSGSQPIVLTGDSHAFWANNLEDEAQRLVGREFGASAVTSPSYEDALPGLPVAAAIQKRNREVVANDHRSKGVLHVRLARDEAQVEFLSVSTIHEKKFDTRSTGSFSLARTGPIRTAQS